MVNQQTIRFSTLLNKIINKQIIRYVALFAGLSLSHSAFAITSLTAQLDPNPAMVAESFNLIVTAKNHTNRNTLDTSDLLKDFIVGQTSVFSNTQISNGSTQQQTTWRIALMSRTAGKYTIPAFTIDNVSSKPIVMTIIDRPKTTTDNSANQDIKLETSINKKTSYVGQRLIYEVKLLLGTGLQRAQLQPPELANAEIKKLDDGQESSEIINGKRYRTVSYQYEIQPTQSGVFELQGAIFRGDVSQYRSGRSKPITLLGENHQITVKSIPNDFPGQWLVSNMVILDDEWAQGADYQVGEPITRTVTLSATGVSAEQLPDLNISSGNLLQSYPDKPKLQQGLNGNILIAQNIQKLALIPIKSGEINVPEIKIPWFNAQTEKVEWAIIPAKTISVAPQAVSAFSQKPEQPPQVITPRPEVKETNIQQGNVHNMTPWYMACALLLTLLVTAISYIIWLRNKNNILNEPVVKSNNSSTKIYDTLLRSLQHNAISDVVRLLPLWLKQDYQLSIEDELPQKYGITIQYNKLVKQQFSAETQAVDCKELKDCVIAFTKNKIDTTAPLSGLYT